jgi:hypothetical protein
MNTFIHEDKCCTYSLDVTSKMGSAATCTLGGGVHLGCTMGSDSQKRQHSTTFAKATRGTSSFVSTYLPW